MRRAAPSFHSTIVLHATSARAVLLSRSLVRSRERSVRFLAHVRIEREHHTRERAQTRIVQRLESRFVHRVAAIAASQAATMSAHPRREVASARFSRLAMTLARPRAPAPASLPPAMAGAQTHADRTGTHAPPRSPSAALAPLPAHELSRVTEHVLRTLDRRVLSYRERTGQL
jgi:hypothetical protein